MGEVIAVKVTWNRWKRLIMGESLPILVNIKADVTSWLWISEPGAAAGLCNGAPRHIIIQKIPIETQKNFFMSLA